jgi:hypothetical protein
MERKAGFGVVFSHVGMGLVALGTSVSPAMAQTKDPAKLVFGADSPTALIAIKTDWWQPAPEMKSAYKIVLSAYDPTDEKLMGGPFAGGALIEAQRKKFAEDYLLTPIKPGRWVFQAYQQQDKWALCFNAATFAFEVKAGEVVYLGDFDAKAHRDLLTLKAVSSGKVSISGYGFADFFDLGAPPLFKPVSDADLPALKAALASYAPQVTAPIRRADYTSAKFGTGSTLFAERRCGGYFTKAAKDMKPKKN